MRLTFLPMMALLIFSPGSAAVAQQGQGAAERILELEQRVDELMSLVRQLHRNSLFVSEVSFVGASVAGPASSATYTFQVCSVLENDDCPAGSPGFEVEFFEGDEGMTFSFSPGDADFSEVATALTDGVDDYVFQRLGLNVGGATLFTVAESSFFMDALGPDDVDFAGAELGRIRFTVDNIFLGDFVNSDNLFPHDVRGRVFFEIAD